MSFSADVAEGDRSTGRTLSADRVVDRIRRWATLYGEPPCTADWNPSVARWRAQEWRVARYRLGDPETGEPWPSTTAAKRRFDGSFDAALRAAGFEPHRSGPRRRAQVAATRAAAGEPARPGRPSAPSAAAPARVDDGRATAAEKRAALAERELSRERVRLARALASLDEARGRARVLGDRARRARLAAEREKARRQEGVSGALASARTALGESELRRAATLEIAAAAERDAQRMRGLASASVREAARLREEVAEAVRRAEAAEEVARGLIADDAGAGAGARLSPGELARLRARAAPGGPAVLGTALRRLAAARAANDRTGLRAALGEVAVAAVAWRDRL